MALLGAAFSMVATLSVQTGAMGDAGAQGVAAPAQIAIGNGQDQIIDGFGFSEAYAEYDLQTLPPATRQQVLRLLFDRRTGAGLDIVRFGLPLPAGSVENQLQLGRTAKSYGVHTFYADAVTAPARMKSNRSLQGGYLCGAPGVDCAGRDARVAYADYLATQAKAFADEGLPLLAIGFVNEPEIAPPYPGMLMTPAQATDFVPYLGRALRARHLGTKVSCCDSISWDSGAVYTKAVMSSPASARYVGLITAHCYAGGPPTVPLTSARPVWEAEWSSFQPWDPSWDDGTPASGLFWANAIYGALTQADVNAFLYWWGAFTSGQHGVDNEGLIKIKQHHRTYQVAARLWAFAGFSRYVRPGAVRLETSTSDPNLPATSFRDGRTQVLIVINNNTHPEEVTVTTGSGMSAGSARPYVTNGRSQGRAGIALPIAGGQFTSTVPARTLESYVLTPGHRRG